MFKFENLDSLAKNYPKSKEVDPLVTEWSVAKIGSNDEKLEV